MNTMIKIISTVGVITMVFALAVVAIASRFVGEPDYPVITLEDRSTVVLNLPVLPEVMTALTAEILLKDQALPPDEPLYLYIYSPGGDVDSGLQFISTLKALGRPIHTINQYSASMALIIAEYLSDRYILPFGTMMAHSVNVGGMSGQIPGSLLTRADLIRREVERINTHIAYRIGTDPDVFTNDLLSEIWISGDEAVQQGYVDKVVLVKCAASLLTGSFTRTVSVFGFQLLVEFSKCPLLSEPLSVKPAQAGAQPVALIRNRRITREVIVNELLELVRKRQTERFLKTE